MAHGVYSQEQYTNEVLHSYISRHLPKEALPYVTFVIWDSLEFLHNYWDQHMIYYHAVTAYSGYADVMATFLDLDEVRCVRVCVDVCGCVYSRDASTTE